LYPVNAVMRISHALLKDALTPMQNASRSKPSSSAPCTAIPSFLIVPLRPLQHQAASQSPP
jgi:hypothetical protein